VIACVVVSLVSAAGTRALGAEDPPVDPFDYSYCGGKPVYPVIGFNFATVCGPRNQIALGRRGKLMWLFPSQDGSTVRAQGARQLAETELAQLTLLAEVAALAAAPQPASGAVRYELGIDFSGRPYQRVRGVLHDDGSSAMALFAAMRRLVPDAPLLPACKEAGGDFRPTRLPAERRVSAGLPEEGTRAAP
jgi:hypothetical protein